MLICLIQVAEACILKWLQKRVKPLVDWERKQLVSYNPLILDNNNVIIRSLKSKILKRLNSHLLLLVIVNVVCCIPKMGVVTLINIILELYSLHNMQSQLLAGPSWGKQPSLDTEDEEGLPESHRRSRLFQNLAFSDEQV